MIRSPTFIYSLEVLTSKFCQPHLVRDHCDDWVNVYISMEQLRLYLDNQHGLIKDLLRYFVAGNEEVAVWVWEHPWQ
ncbi:MAG TPA: hypothetical protein EYG51_24060 [Pseudomonadales bacterium]|nr:hypothetical protein [Pseudomonadales bacterium]